MPTPEEVKKALELIRKRTATHDYFFSKLSSPDWIEPLEKAGVFLTPPDAKREATGISFPSWPEAEYLSRMAGLLPETVLSIMLKTPPTDNVRIHDNFASAAAAMPGQLVCEVGQQGKQMAREAATSVLSIARQPCKALSAPRARR